MEPAKIDWKSIESIFVEDELYEHISAPKWIDFSAPDQSVDDDAWFCRPDCRHPRTAEDFQISTTPSSKAALQHSGDAAERLPLGNRNSRDMNYKRRVLPVLQPSNPLKSNSRWDEFTQDSENQNPNLSTAPHSQHHHQSALTKGAAKSSTKKKQPVDDSSPMEETPWLKRTLSARNLFAGRDILNQITDFCHELKRLAVRRGKDRENEEKTSLVIGKQQRQQQQQKQPVTEAEREIVGGELKDSEMDRRPLLEIKKEKTEQVREIKKSNSKPRKKWVDDAENTPPAIDLKKIRRKDESLLQIRTNPPSPQCFSATRGTSKVTPLKPSRCKPPERTILQDAERSNKEVRKDLAEGNDTKSVSTLVDREGRSLDVLWFLKPCTLSS